MTGRPAPTNLAMLSKRKARWYWHDDFDHEVRGDGLDDYVDLGAASATTFTETACAECGEPIEVHAEFADMPVIHRSCASVARPPGRSADLGTQTPGSTPEDEYVPGSIGGIDGMIERAEDEAVVDFLERMRDAQEGA